MDYDLVYDCIPESEKGLYGSAKEEQCENFLRQHPDFLQEPDVDLPDLSSDEKMLDYIVQTVTNTIGAKNLAYKGGYILNKLIPNTRKTYDVDFSIARVELYEDVKKTLASIGDFLISEGFITNYKMKEAMMDTTSGGIKFIRTGNTDLGVDVGLHPLNYGITSMKLDFCDIERFTIERSLSDKIMVICSQKRFRRVKDLYDTYMLIRMFDINGSLLKECCENRKVDYSKIPNDEIVIIQLEHAYNKLTLGSDTLDAFKPSFVETYNAVMKFIVGSMSSGEKTWNHERGVWL